MAKQNRFYGGFSHLYKCKPKISSISIYLNHYHKTKNENTVYFVQSPTPN